PELGIGNFIIKSKKIDAQKDANTYLINVYEKYSSIYLQVEPSALLYQYGDEFKAIISMQNNENIYPLDEISASLVGPGSQVIPLKIEEIGHNKFQASAIMLSEVNPHGENWYIEVDASGKSDEKNIISRTGRAALSYSIPSASLINIKRVSSNPLILAATVEVANASRYVLQSVLYRRNARGEAVPVETAQSAQWLKPGKHTIKFSFDNSAHLAEDMLSVGYLHLTDYGQMKPVYQFDSPIKLSQLLD
ncbi:MAG: DUF4785 family protein, partial [Legionella longbeachae]|nr:DUF4785 family protein [Legionella longbeachae]